MICKGKKRRLRYSVFAIAQPSRQEQSSLVSPGYYCIVFTLWPQLIRRPIPLDIYACYFYKNTVKVGAYVLANLPDSLKSHLALLN